MAKTKRNRTSEKEDTSSATPPSCSALTKLGLVMVGVVFNATWLSRHPREFNASKVTASDMLSPDEHDFELSVIRNVEPIERERKPKRRIVLLGPHDRYNFGDLLFEKVVSKLLITRAGYLDGEIIRGGLLDVNMSHYGGVPNVISMKRVQEMSRRSALAGTGAFDIVYTGGEALGCSFSCGINMLPTNQERQLAKQDKIWDCAYLIPKQLLLPQENQSTNNNITFNNQAVVNSLGGSSMGSPACAEAEKAADYVAYRDKDPIAPDSAVLTKKLHRETIALFAEENLKELFPNNQVRRDYIAVQHKKPGMASNITKQKEFARAMDAVAQAYPNCTLVFFAGGTVPNHDSFPLYHNITKLMAQPSIVFEGEHVWKVVGLISRAKAILSTSLHVRIMSFIFHKPRVTWCTGNKHKAFIKYWDAADSPRCTTIPETLEILKKYMGEVPQINQTLTVEAYNRALKMYLNSFDKWANIINK